jgi:iron(III) transport system ATP-binding protein
LKADVNSNPAIEAFNVTRQYGGGRALDDVSISIRQGEIICLVGPSGCGKSSLLRVISGVDAEHSGEVKLFGRTVAGGASFVEPEDRRVGFMLQDYALFPHLSVADNISFGVRKRSKAERASLTARTIERLGLQSLTQKYPHMLSGGEQQRVALARALTPEPPVMLMDEPFSNLDRRLADTIRQETLSILRELGTTSIIVTHDPEEALSSCDRIALMRQGRILQFGTPYDLYYHPLSRYAADYFCAYNQLPAIYENGQLVTALGRFPANFKAANGARAVVYVRPQAVTISRDGNGLPGRIVNRTFKGDAEQLTLLIDGTSQAITAHIPYLLPDGEERVQVVIPPIGVLGFAEG